MGVSAPFFDRSLASLVGKAALTTSRQLNKTGRESAFLFRTSHGTDLTRTRMNIPHATFNISLGENELRRGTDTRKQTSRRSDQQRTNHVRQYPLSGHTKEHLPHLVVGKKKATLELSLQPSMP